MRECDRARTVIWLASPDVVCGPSCIDGTLAVLSEEERDQVQRLRFERDRRIAIASHALQRAAVASAVGCAPDELRFVRRSGRPELAPPSPVHFSTSNTEGLVMCAVSSSPELGVDVERIRHDACDDLLERCIGPAERAALRALPTHARHERWFTLWTLKEAFAKATGLPLHVATRETVFEFSRGIPRLVAAPVDPAGWDLVSWTPTPGHRAALCCRPLSGAFSRFKLLWICEDGARRWGRT